MFVRPFLSTEWRAFAGVDEARSEAHTCDGGPAWPAGHIPIATSAQCSPGLLLRNSMTPGSIVAGRSCGSTAVATIMSQRSLKATDSADLPGGLWAVSA